MDLEGAALDRRIAEGTTRLEEYRGWQEGGDVKEFEGVAFMMVGAVLYGGRRVARWDVLEDGDEDEMYAWKKMVERKCLGRELDSGEESSWEEASSEVEVEEEVKVEVVEKGAEDVAEVVEEVEEEEEELRKDEDDVPFWKKYGVGPVYEMTLKSREEKELKLKAVKDLPSEKAVKDLGPSDDTDASDPMDVDYSPNESEGEDTEEEVEYRKDVEMVEKVEEEEKEEEIPKAEQKEEKKEEKKVKRRRNRRKCPQCGVLCLQVPRHMKNVHGVSREEAKKASSASRATEGRQKSMATACKFPGCGTHVVRMDRHLTRVHKLEKGSEEYLSLNTQDTLGRIETRQAAEEAASKPVKVKSKPPRWNVIPPTPEKSEKPKKLPHVEGLKNARPPKKVKRNALRKKLEDVLILRAFKQHLVSFDGGRRPEHAAKDHVRHVGYILFQVEDPPRNVKLLWKDSCLSTILNTVIQGNKLLPEEEQLSPGTLKSYVTSLKLFYKYILGRRSEITDLLDLTPEDVDAIHQAELRVSVWLSSFKDDLVERRVKVHRQDQLEILKDEEYSALVNSEPAKRIQARFRTIQGPNIPASEYVELRDYLLVRILVGSAQRPGAAANFSVEEFYEGHWVSSDAGDDQFYAMETVHHKTGGDGPAQLLWSHELYEMALVFLNVLRPTVVSDISVFPDVGLPRSDQPFFINVHGGYMPSSRVSRRLTEMGNVLCPTMVGNLSGKRIRKSAVSLHRTDTSTVVSKEALAKQMTHSVRTAGRNYDVGKDPTQTAKMASYLSRKLQPTSSTHTISKAPPFPPETSSVPPPPSAIFAEPQSQPPPPPPPETEPESPPPPPPPPSSAVLTLTLPLQVKQQLLQTFGPSLDLGTCPSIEFIEFKMRGKDVFQGVDPAMCEAYLRARVPAQPSVFDQLSNFVVFLQCRQRRNFTII